MPQARRSKLIPAGPGSHWNKGSSADADGMAEFAIWKQVVQECWLFFASKVLHGPIENQRGSMCMSQSLCPAECTPQSQSGVRMQEKLLTPPELKSWKNLQSMREMCVPFK